MTENRIEEVPGTSPTAEQAKQAVVIDFLKAVEKLSGKGWFKQNENTLKEQLQKSLAQLPVRDIHDPDYDPLADALEEGQESETEKALRIQLTETIDANSTLNDNYQEAHKSLIDLAAVCVGGIEKLRERAPLDTAKLRDIITDTLDNTKLSSGSVDASGFDTLGWVLERKKNLKLIGHGPLANGRYEGEHDVLVQIENAVRRSVKK